MKILNEFLNSYLRQFPEKRKVKAMEVLGELAGGIENAIQGKALLDIQLPSVYWTFEKTRI